ncbi:toxin co-regulated pilus biosynthesis Q family protein [Achromobacter mucicolens]|uniref:toxin co-regulated pilus biosynthesis Q family protein n=1 Tax=Achromobacter mucicolens TaxID=1389922 RepID=UPI0024493DD3|nr:toxin co-regulated pilus biosynthesis Q family protein [Achromobacter mucicolens]MDH0090898.1 toxin co-regulated pilus biosynthesis Q family protein [Achromobacter mucicolens]
MLQSAPEPAPTPVVLEPIVPKPIWQIQPEDGTVRQALVRWAAKAGWTFGPDQWELNFDLPIQAPAQFEADSFEDATRALSESIAMTELPVRPCFYANHVLRVIPFTRSCNRAAAATP